MGHITTNNNNAGTAWSLLGLTIRLAQGLGLHRNCPPSVPSDVIFARSKIWWALVWQDSLISITFDRASTTTATDHVTMPMPQQLGPINPYHSVCYPLFKIGLDIVYARSVIEKPRELYARMVRQRDDILLIMNNAAEYLRDSRKCTTNTEMMEHLGAYLHSSYHLSELFRPALSPSADPDIARDFKQPCIENLINTIEAYIGLQNVNNYVRQSWAAMHRGLSSALLIGILGEHTRNERARLLVARFVAVMANLTSNYSPQEIHPPVQRGICALQKLNIPGTQDMQGAFGFCTPADANLGVVDGDGALKLKREVSWGNSVFTPATTESGSDGKSEGQPDGSPYSVLNTILWGTQDAIGEMSVY